MAKLSKSAQKALEETKIIFDTLKALSKYGVPQCSYKDLAEAFTMLGSSRPALAACIRMGFVRPDRCTDSPECQWTLA